MNREQTSIIATASSFVVFGLGTPGHSAAHAQITLDDPQHYFTSSSLSGMSLADMDRDGLRDLVVAERLAILSLFENLSDGDLLRIGSYFQPATRPAAIASADFDRDGDTDIAWSVQNEDLGASLKVFYNSGDGRSGSITTVSTQFGLTESMVAADVTGDGYPDLVTVDITEYDNRILVYHNDAGQLTETESILPPEYALRSVQVGDIDSDGDLDIAVLNSDEYDNRYYGWMLYQSTVQILLNDGMGRFPDARFIELPFYGGYGTGYFPDIPVRLRMGDLDGDGDPDLALAAARYVYSAEPIQTLILENNQQGTVFIEQAWLYSPGEARLRAGLELSDLDTDGDLDVILQDYFGVSVADNHGDFTFAPPVYRATIPSSRDQPIAVGDLDNDGQSDLVVTDATGFSTLTNITPLTGPILDHTPLNRGAQVTLTVADAQPGEIVDFFYSRSGAGNSLGQQDYGGLTLDLLDPINPAGSAVADANGVAVLTMDIPTNAPLITVIIQAAIARGVNGEDSVKTPFRTARIQP